MPTKIEKDFVTGTDTTGHEWDGIKELDTPMPKWWVWVFVLTCIWAIGYCVLYPSAPYGPGYFAGLFNYSSRDKVNTEVASVAAARAGSMDRIAALPYDAIRKDPALMEIALTAGKIKFAENCAPCHAAGGAGRTGYPALAAGGWIWGGTLADLEQTITHGIRSNDADTRRSQMPRFGLDGMLTAEQIDLLTDHVWTRFYGHDGRLANAAGAEALYAENCAACHGANGEGSRSMGAPRLASRVHLYGDNREQIATQIRTGRGGVMPNWNMRLDPATLKSLVLYVHSLGGGE